MDPAEIGRYSVTERIGQGGVGIVYRAHDPMLDRSVAIKVLSESWVDDAAQVTRFEREARTLARFNHPHIATIYGIGRTDAGHHFLVLEFIEGQSLGERLREGPPLPPRECVEIARQIAAALVAAHRRDVVHRDLKPDNVLLDLEGQAKVLDFGMAKNIWADAPEDDDPPPSGVAANVADTAGDTITISAGDALTIDVTPAPLVTQTGAVVGTPGYMSPEQLRGESLDKPTDVFAFGSLLFECVTGSRVFSGKTIADLIASTLTQEPDWSLWPADGSASALKSMARRALAKDPAERPTAQDLLSELEFTLDSTEVRAVTEAEGRERGNLPARLSHFVGRKSEREQVTALLGEASSSNRRLVTLTGAGGCGKSRFSLEVAGDLAARFEQGAWFAELASVADAQDVAYTVATAMGLQPEKERSAQSVLIDHWTEREALLVFDNCEHLLPAVAALVEELLGKCPRVRVMATSREALGLEGETIFALAPLSIPQVDPLGADRGLAESVRATEAGELFEDRARQAKPGFRIDETNASHVAAICTRLDGLPLAIELAAARVRAMSPEKIADRLTRDFRILTGGSRTALPRQQTMRAAFDWSYQLLSSVERALFQRLSVFGRGASLEAIEHVCADPEDAEEEFLPEWQILDVLTALVEKSLVVYEEDGDRGRYRLLETGRQFGCDEIRRSDGVGRIRDRHLEYFLSVAEEAAPQLIGPEQASWLRCIAMEHENLKAALDWATGRENDEEAALRLASSLWRFWSIRGHSIVGLSFLETALAQAPDSTSDAKGQALFGAGILSRNLQRHQDALDWLEQCEKLAEQRSDENLRAQALVSAGGIRFFQRAAVDEAREELTQGLEIHERLNNERGVANAMNSLGWIAVHEGKPDEAFKFYSKALEVRRRLDESHGVAMTLVSLAYLHVDREEIDQANATLEESLQLLESIEARGAAMGIVHSALGLVRFFQGNSEASRAHFETCLRIQEDLGSRYGAAYANYYLAQLNIREGRLDDAGRILEHALQSARDLNSARLTADLVIATEQLAAARGDHREAARFHGAAKAVRESDEIVLPSFERPALIREFPMSREALGDEAFEKEYGVGQQQNIQAVQSSVLEYLATRLS